MRMTYLLRMLLLILMISLSFLPFPTESIDALTIYPGVSVQSIPIGGKTFDDVQQILHDENQKVSLYKIYLHFPDRESIRVISFGELGIEVDKNKIWQEAYALGRSGSWLEKIKVRCILTVKGINLPLYLKFNHSLTQKKLTEIFQPWYITPKDAQFVITADDKVVVQQEKIGERIALEEAMLSLQKQILLNHEKEVHLYLKLEKIQPKKVKEELESYKISTCLSSFTTRFNPSNLKRTNNIRLAVKELALILLPPGEVFSFNDVVGPRTKEKGYDEADIIQDYQLVPGVGGGICQVSSTLYNAVLLADLEVVERYPHSLMINYVPPGLDATVVYGYRDFKFKNNTEGYLLINVQMAQDTLSCKIFGQPEQKKRVELKSFVETEDLPGQLIRVERHVYNQNGELIRKEVISKDYYPPETMSITERVIL